MCVCVCVLIYLGLIFVLLVNDEGDRVIIIVFLAGFFILLEIHIPFGSA